MSVSGDSTSPTWGLEADLVMTRGLIHTMNRDRPVAEALAVKGERVVAIGHESEVRPLIGGSTFVVDLDGRVVIPGLTDCHVHVAGQAAMSHHVDVRDFFHDVPDVDTVLQLMAERAVDTLPGEWVTAHGSPMQDARFREGQLPTRHDLDRAIPHHPAFVFFGGHITVANSQALRRARITRDTVPPARGVIEVGSEGEPNGVLREAAQNLVKRLAPTVASLEDAMAREFELAAMRGVTSVHEITNGPDEVAALKALATAGRLPCRVQMLIRVIESRFPSNVLLDLGMRDGFGSNMLRIGGVKMSVDGGFTGRNSAFYEPLEGGDPGHPMIRIEREELTDLIRRHHQAGVRVCVHAMGDRAVDMTLDAFDAVLTDNPRSDHRHRVEHLGNWQLAGDRLSRVSDLGLIPVPNPVFLHYLGETTIEALGPPRAEAAWPFRAIVDAGVPLVFGTDAPAYWPIDPLRDIATAVTRRTRSGTDLYAEQGITAFEALQAATTNAAYVGGVEDDLGTIEAGKLADLTVLDSDPLSTEPNLLADIGVEMTVVDGRIVFDRTAPDGRG